jgi:hypothetical protein
MKKWLRNWKIRKSLDDDVPLPDTLNSELRRDMKEWRRYQAELQLVRRLQSESSEEREEAPPFLRARIMNAVSDLERDVESPVVRPFAAAWAGILTVALLIVFAGILVFKSAVNPPGSRPEIASSQSSSQFKEAASQVLKIVDLAEGARVQTWGAKINQPLENEVRLALNDARTAMDQLALRFLPEDSGVYGFFKSDD